MGARPQERTNGVFRDLRDLLHVIISSEGRHRDQEVVGACSFKLNHIPAHVGQDSLSAAKVDDGLLLLQPLA